MDQRMVVEGEEFLTLTLGDTYPLGVFFKAHPSRRRGVVWPTQDRINALKQSHKKTFFLGNLGGIARMGDGLAGVVTTFIRDDAQKPIQATARVVLFLRFDKNARIRAERYLTTDPETRGLEAYVGAFGGKALVAWGVRGKRDTTFAVMNDDGSYAIAPWQAKRPLGARAGFASMPDGDLVWAYARNGARKIELHRAVLPKALRSAAAGQDRSTPDPVELQEKKPVAAAPPKQMPPKQLPPRKVPPPPNGKVKEVVTHFASGEVRARYSIDGDKRRTGWSLRYYRSGQVKARAEYAVGVQWGRCEEYHPNGTLRVSTTFVEGRQHGERVEYDADGKVVLRQSYRDGELVAGDRVP
jgi:hypothetical protein